MSNSVVLYETPGTFAVPAEAEGLTVFKADLVVGMQPFDAASVREHGYEFSSTEHTEELRLSPRLLTNIVEFYRQTRAQERPRAFYNCHVFAGYVAGQIVELPSGERWRSEWRERSASPDNLEPGEVYAIKDEQGVRVHSVLGINRPEMNLSILGNRSPLVVSRTEDLMVAYGGKEVVQLVR